MDKLFALADNLPDFEFEFIYVDDNSTDNSFAVLQEITLEDTRVQIIKLTKNFGANIAIFAGLTYSTGDCVLFIAADLQDPPETLIKMIQEWQLGYKIVFAIRKERKGDPWITRFFANVFNWIFTKLVFKNYPQQGIGFFLIDRAVVDIIIRSNEKNPHIIGLVLWTGFEYKMVEYYREERLYGKSQWTFSKKLKYFIDAFTAFSYLPLRLASTIGLILASLGGIYAIILIILRLFNKITVQGWTALIVIILLSSGLQLIMLGIIGEYLWRNFDATRQRPTFIVDKVLESERNID
jgi:dolichol-phosphate mannosyltransferase